MLTLIQRCTETRLDQWALWRLPSVFGEVFIDVRRGSPSRGNKIELYDDMARWVEPRD